MRDIAMTDEEIKLLAEKIVSGNSSKEESLLFMKEMNSLLEDFKKELKK